MSTPSRRIQVLIAVLLAGLMVANVVASRALFTRPYPSLSDYMTVWAATYSYWHDGLDPYGEEATLRTQIRIYGRPAQGDELPNDFAYPLYTVVLMAPFVALPYSWASAIWLVLLEAALIASLILLLDLFGWRPPPWLFALLLLWTLIHYFAARGLILGQWGVAVYGGQVVTLWALARRQDRLAGVALALSTVKPQMGFLLIPLLLLWAMQARRWRFVASFSGVMAVLVLISFAIDVHWMASWLREMREYSDYTSLGAPTWIVTQKYLGLGAAGEWAANLALWALMLWAWAGVLLRRQIERFDWTIMLTLTVTHLSALRTATPHFVVFTIPLVFYLAALARHRRIGNARILGLLGLLLVLPWAHFALTFEDKHEHPTVYLAAPLIMLLVLWLTRRQWWAAGSRIAGQQGAEVNA